MLTVVFPVLSVPPWCYENSVHETLSLHQAQDDESVIGSPAVHHLSVQIAPTSINSGVSCIQ